MEQYLSLSEIELRVDEMASRINVDMEKHFAYGYVLQNPHEHPYVEVRQDGYWFIVRERGKIELEEHTQDIQELLYWIFESATSSVAGQFALKHPFPASLEQRRVAWKKQLELLNTISPSFKERCKRKITEILTRCPASDGFPNNADYEEWEWDIVPERTAEQ